MNNQTAIRDRLCFLLARMLFPCVLAAARIRRLFVRDATAPGKRRIIVLSDHRLGDTIHQVPLFEALRRAFPADQNHLAVVVRPSLAELVRKMPWFDEVIPGDALERHPIFWLLHGHLWKASVRRFEMMIDSVRLRVVGHDWLNVLWQPARSVAYDSQISSRSFSFVGNWQRRHGDGLWTHLIPTRREKGIEQDFQRFVDAASGQGTMVDVSHCWTVPASPAIVRAARADVILSPGSNAVCRRWPIESFRELVSRLLEKHPSLRFSVVGGATEAPLGNVLADCFPGHVENLCGKTSILELAALLAPGDGRHFVVSNDTGTAHLASVQGTRTIVIFGGGEFGAFFPAPYRQNVQTVFRNRDCFGCGWRCPYADLDRDVAPCVKAIHVEDVMKAVEAWV